MFMIFRSKPIIGPLNIHGLLALAGVLGPVLLLAGDLGSALSREGYSMVEDSISSLALTPLGWLQTIGFLAIGLLVEIYVAGLLFNIRGKRGFGWAAGLLVFFGFGLLMIGAFRTDPVGAQSTIEGIIHGVASKLVFIIFPVAALLISPSIKDDPRWRHLFIYTLVTGILGFLLIAAVLISDGTDWFGLFERLLVLNMIAWVEVTALQLLRLSLRRGEGYEDKSGAGIAPETGD